MRLRYFVFAAITAASRLHAPANAQTQAPTIRTSTTLVEVPVIVHSPNGDLVHGLQQQDFQLLDNGQPQSFQLEENVSEPVAVVVLLQTGGAAPRQFPNYRGLTTMLEYALGDTPYRISLVTFDSIPEQRWPFSTNVNNLAEAFLKPSPGDRDADVLTAIEYGLDWFQDQHPRGRRLILLVSQQRFSGSAQQMQHTLQRLAQTNTAIYSLGFSVESTWLKDQFTHERHANPPYNFGADHAPLTYTFDLGTPLKMAIGSMQANGAESLASLSGGIYLPFTDQKTLEAQISGFANDLANRYVLSFQPTSTAQGLHPIQVTTPTHPGYQVSARSSYWRSADPAGK